MPKDLAALLLEDGAVSPEALGRAQARQRELGGALDTALLEEGALSEAALLALLARASDLPAAPDVAWSATDARARRVFPSRVAERHGLAPFALDGRELSLVATYPVDLGLLDEISFMLSLHLTAHVGLEWRVRELIHRLYGCTFAPRLAALAASAGAEPPPAAEEAPSPEPRPEAPPPAPPPTGFERDASEPSEPLAEALRQALEAVDPALFAEEEGAEAEPEEEPAPQGPPPDRSAPPRWSLADAKAALAAARHRDEVVLAVLRYARDFFEYAAMFAVTRDAVAGHDALGAEDERDRARSIAIYADDPGIFRTVIQTQSPYLGPVSREAHGNEVILHGLGRGTPRTVLVHPILLRDRTVCILYADNGEAPVSARRLGDLVVVLSSAGAAFERIIRTRKRRRAAPARGTFPFAAPAPQSRQEAPAPPAARDERTAAPTTSAPSPPRSGGEGWGVAASATAASIPPSTATPTATSTPPEPEAPPVPPAGPAPPAWFAASATDAVEEEFFSGGPSIDVDLTEPEPAPAGPSEPAAASAAPPPAPPEPLSFSALADRALDADAAVSGAASAELAKRRRDPAIRQACEKLRRALLSGISSRATRAARALGAIRDVESIPLLIQVLEASEPETAAAAADALAGITLQRIGADARGWLAWWKQNRGRGRAEWLFSGLTSADRATRVAASVELSLAAPPPVPYSADAPPAERERIARAWAGWWARSGHVL